MKSKLKIVLLCSFFLSITLASCNDTKSIKPAKNNVVVIGDDEEIKNKIEKITQIINKAVLENDYDTQLKYFTEDAIIVPPLGPAVKGKKEIKNGFDKNVMDKVVLHSFNAAIEDFWVCGNRVYERGKWAMAQSSKLSNKPKAYYGSYFEIWEVQKDSSVLIDYMIYTLGFNPFENN